MQKRPVSKCQIDNSSHGCIYPTRLPTARPQWRLLSGRLEHSAVTESGESQDCPSALRGPPRTCAAQGLTASSVPESAGMCCRVSFVQFKKRGARVILVCSMPPVCRRGFPGPDEELAHCNFGVGVGFIPVFDQKETSCSRTMKHPVSRRLSPYQKEQRTCL